VIDPRRSAIAVGIVAALAACDHQGARARDAAVGSEPPAAEAGRDDGSRNDVAALVDGDGSGPSRCADTEVTCADGCTDVSSDPANCGACGAACPADAACVAGVCACSGAREICGARCVDTMRDAANCGVCDHACARGVPCFGGACIACGTGLAACAGLCTDVASDASNCGACGAAYTGTIPCIGGTCVCPAGATACGSTCVDLTRDDANCGGCGMACATGTLCFAAQCRPCGVTVAFEAQVQPILTANCLGATCHQAPVSAQDLDLEAGVSYAQLVGMASGECGVLRVAPGDAAESALMRVLTGAPCGDVPRMPLDAAPLAAVDMDAVRAWICEGAPDN
jgi:hypothetical protein